MRTYPTAAIGAKIIVYQSELDRIAGWAASHPRTETGGGLFGYRTHSGVPVVAVALGPGPLARHEATAFFQDMDFLKRKGKELNQSHGLQYIGEWHSHHLLGLDHPSAEDCSTVAAIFERNPFDDFFLCIVNLHERDGDGNRSMGMTAGAFHFVRGQRAPATAAWVVLGIDSPIAAQIYADPALGLHSSELRRIWTVPQTTLDAPSAPPQPDPLGGLMNRPQGHAFFTALHDRLTQAYGKPEMRVFGDGSVTFGVLSGGQAFTLNLPNGFPERPATLIRGDGKTPGTRLLLPASGLEPLPFFASIEKFIADEALRRREMATVATREPREKVHRMPANLLALMPLAGAAVLAFGLLAWWIGVRSAAVENLIANLANQQQSLSAKVEGLGSRLDGLPAMVTTRLEPLQTQIAALQRDVAAAQTEIIANLANRQQSLSARVESLGSRLDGLSAIVATRLEPLQSQIAALQRDVAAARTDIAATPDRLAPLSAAVAEGFAGLQGRITALEDRMTALEGKLDKLDSTPPAVDPAPKNE